MVPAGSERAGPGRGRAAEKQADERSGCTALTLLPRRSRILSLSSPRCSLAAPPLACICAAGGGGGSYVRELPHLHNSLFSFFFHPPSPPPRQRLQHETQRIIRQQTMMLNNNLGHHGPALELVRGSGGVRGVSGRLGAAARAGRRSCHLQQTAGAG